MWVKLPCFDVNDGCECLLHCARRYVTSCWSTLVGDTRKRWKAFRSVSAFERFCMRARKMSCAACRTWSSGFQGRTLCQGCLISRYDAGSRTSRLPYAIVFGRTSTVCFRAVQVALNRVPNPDPSKHPIPPGRLEARKVYQELVQVKLKYLSPTHNDIAVAQENVAVSPSAYSVMAIDRRW